MQTLELKKGHDKRLQKGHLWVFSNELIKVPAFEPGSVVEVRNSDGGSYGLGFFNPSSLIAVRMLLTDNEIDHAFFYERLKSSYDFRKIIYPGEKNYRLVFGESDFLPGLIIDKFEDYFAVQILSAGMEIRKQMIFDSLIELFPNTIGIIEKNTSKLRQLEGLQLFDKESFGRIPKEFDSTDKNIKIRINLSESQKTGYFLDQRENRHFIRRIARGFKVLDCYCNQGGFALNAAIAGAESVTCVDSSAPALELASKNAGLNGFDNFTFQNSDVVEYLENHIRQKSKWDLIILDPPAFAKNKKSVPKGLAGYAKINKLALNLLAPSGYLATSSCSQHVEESDFQYVIEKEAAKQSRQLRLVFRGMQAPDHPILASMPETRYLKFFVYEVQ